jgi:hypothetical protein
VGIAKRAGHFAKGKAQLPAHPPAPTGIPIFETAPNRPLENKKTENKIK